MNVIWFGLDAMILFAVVSVILILLASVVRGAPYLASDRKSVAKTVDSRMSALAI